MCLFSHFVPELLIMFVPYSFHCMHFSASSELYPYNFIVFILFPTGAVHINIISIIRLILSYFKVSFLLNFFSFFMSSNCVPSDLTFCLHWVPFLYPVIFAARRHVVSSFLHLVSLVIALFYLLPSFFIVQWMGLFCSSFVFWYYLSSWILIKLFVEDLSRIFFYLFLGPEYSVFIRSYFGLNSMCVWAFSKIPRWLSNIKINLKLYKFTSESCYNWSIT